MGGASLQISYPLDESQFKHDDPDYVSVNLNKKYHIYAHSYLGYGLDIAQKELQQQVPDKFPKCYPPGFDRECRIQCTKDFVIQNKDHSTVVSENWAQLKACRVSCKTAECQPTTKAPTTTKPTTTRRVIHRPVTKKEYIKLYVIW